MNNQIKSTLPHKELSLFKRIVKCYEQKQFKNGLKFSKQILSNSKFCEHGETLAMKGLILSCTGKREEAYECVKRGIKNDINSSICWHVYGLVQKSDRKYDEAMKCYLRALKMDKDNIQILRDLSLLQIQMRNFEGYLETRGQLFQLRPSQKASWLGYVVALHLLENYDEAIRILDEFTKVQQNIPPYNNEHSELLMYYAMLLMESGKFEKALEFLSENEKFIVDKVNLNEFRGELSLKLGLLEQAQSIYFSLIDRNPENSMYYEKLLTSMNIENDEARLLELFDMLIEKYPRSLMTRWIPLKNLHGENFISYADVYLKKCLRKGVWALFVQLKFLYNDEKKVAVLEELYEQYKRNIYLHQSLDGETGKVDPPTVEIYVNYLLAEHYSHVGRIEEALTIVDNQLMHTPTLIEFYSLKGKIYYEGGNIWLASKCLDEAQSMDTADRFINCLCTRYMVEAGRYNDAEEMAAKFTREGMRSTDNLNEMQCMWFLNTMAKSCQRLHKYADSLQKCHEVNKHFVMMVDDQFDFHSYCLRKTTLRSYVELLRTEDKLRDHKFYFEAAKTAIEVYLHINDHPVGPEGDDDNLNIENLSISEAKKLKSKLRKQKRKAENEAVKKQQEQEKRDQIQKLKTQDKEDLEMVEEKIDGAKLIKTAAPLDEAIKFLQPLLTLSPRNLESQCLAFKIYEKKDKILLMLKAIKCGLEIPGSLDNPDFHECLIKFLILIKQRLPSTSETVRTVIEKVMANAMPGGLDAMDKCAQLNREFYSRNSKSILHQFYVWHIENLIKTGSRGAVQITNNCDYFSPLKSLDPAVSAMAASNWKDCEIILNKLKEVYSLNEKDGVYNSLREKFEANFPCCISFMTALRSKENQNTPIIVAASHFYPSGEDQHHVVNGHDVAISNSNSSNNNIDEDGDDDEEQQQQQDYNQQACNQ